MKHTKTRKVIAWLLALAITAALTPSVCLSAMAAVWGGGTVTPSMNAEGYYLIDTGEKLAWFSNRVNSGYKTIKAKQTANLDMGSRAFTPIGTSTYPFLGIYDGGGNTIANLKVEGNLENRGLFGYLGKTVTKTTLYDDFGDPYTETTNVPSQVNNVVLTNANIKGTKAVGGIAGNNEGGAISGCSVSGTIEVTESNGGGIVGHNRSMGSVLNCENNATVKGPLRVGGIAGFCASDASVKGSCNKGTVSGTNYIGGLVGTSSGSTVSHSYNLGNVSATTNVCGGLVGYGAYGDLYCMYTLGTVTCPGEYVGIAFGNISYGTNIEKCYFDRDNSTMRDDFATPAEHILMVDELFLGSLNMDFDIFVGDYFGTNNGYPLLRWQLVAWDGSVGEPSKDASGNYLITGGSELAWFAALVNGKLPGVARNSAAKAKVTKDILLNPAIFDETANVWTPIGSADYPFTGTFDGGEYRISGIYIPAGNDILNAGLFGVIGSGGVVKNIFVETSRVNGKTDTYSSVGMIAGRNGGTIQNCFNYGTVIASYTSGGIVGQNDNTATVQNCGNIGEVKGSNYSGGIAGNSAGKVISCFNMGIVSGVQRTGGIIGTNYGVIQYCYNTGKINGVASVGGVVGYQNSSEYNGFYACYNIGAITGSASGKGAVMGYFANGDVRYCYYDSERSNAGDNNATPKTSKEMAEPTSLSAFYGFSSTYWIDRAPDQYFDYSPELRVFYNSTNTLLKTTSKESAAVLKAQYTIMDEVDGEMNTYYPSLQSASDHIAKGRGVITILSDSEISATVKIPGKVTIQDNSTTRTISRASGFGGNLIVAEGELTLKGTGANKLVINGGGTSRLGDALIKVATTGTVYLQEGVKVTNNVSTGNGGGIYVDGDGSKLMLQGGIITGNMAVNGGGIYNFAGAVYGESGTIQGNTASANGGGIFCEGRYAENELTALTITGNTATNGGGIYNKNSPVNFAGGTITSNTANNGGGIYNGGTLSLTGGSISGNTANANGGAIYENGTLSMANEISIAASNDVYLAAGKTIVNTAAIKTSGIVATITTPNYYPGTRVLSGDFCASNYAKFAMNVPAGKSEYFINSTGYLVDREMANVAKVSVFGAYDVYYTSLKEAVDSIGVDADGNPITGLIMMVGDDIVEEPIEVKGNITIIGDGSEPRTITRFRTCTGNMFAIAPGATLEFGSLDQDNNEALIIDGGSELYGTYGDSMIRNNGTFKLYDGASLINSNISGNGSMIYNTGRVDILGGFMDNGTAEKGGFIYTGGTSEFTMTAGQIQNGTATDGGAIYAADTAVVSFQGGIITENTATNGGAVYVKGAEFTMPGGFVITTETDGNGESQYVEKPVSGTLTSNTAVYGGGVYMDGGTGAISKGVISENASTSGGAVYMTEGSTFTVSAGTIENNTAKRYGAAIYDAGSLTLSGAVASTNDIYLLNGKVIEVTGTTMTALITPSAYSIGTKILSGSNIAQVYTNFALSNNIFFILPDGTISTNALSLKATSPMTIDYEEDLITGIDQSANTVAEIRAQFDNSSTALIFMSADSFLLDEDSPVTTGSVILLVGGDGATLDSKTFVIFGDIDGDGDFDGEDAVLAKCLANGKLTESQVSSAAYRAADADRSGSIDETDADLLRACGMLKQVVPQR